MAKAKYYMIFIDRNKDSNYENVKEKMNLAIDWYRIRENLWIVYTTSDQFKWYERLKNLVKNDGHVFICLLDIHQRQGWMKNKFWSWLKKDRS